MIFYIKINIIYLKNTILGPLGPPGAPPGDPPPGVWGPWGGRYGGGLANLRTPGFLAAQPTKVLGAKRRAAPDPDSRRNLGVPKLAFPFIACFVSLLYKNADSGQQHQQRQLK